MSAGRGRNRLGPAVPKTWAKLLERCPFRTLIGAEAAGHGTAALLPRPSHTVALLGGDPAPIDPGMMAQLVASVQAGGTVLILADRADLRDYARREIMAMVLPAAGQA